MPWVTLIETGRRVQAERGSNLLRILLEAGAKIESSCKGRGTCGKCLVRVDPPESASPAGSREGFVVASEVVLACQTEVTGDLSVEVISRRFGPVRTAPEELPAAIPPEEPLGAGLGLAVDLGTTTIAATLIDSTSGRVLCSATGMNPQTALGLDVITRITAAGEPGGLERLTSLVGAGISDLAGLLLSRCGEPTGIEAVTVAGNPTMLHLAAGISPESIGRHPYAAVFLDPRTIPARDLIAGCAVGATATLLPSVSSFVGADVAAGLVACDLDRAVEPVLYLDLGTNGEMVLCGIESPLAASCAAGPALEGMNISRGMPAADGAVEHLSLEPLSLEVIGGGEPVGICGSGIVDLVAELLRVGGADSSGRMLASGPLPDTASRMEEGAGGALFRLAPGVGFTQKDLRQVQLAKGAVLSGVRLLLREAGLPASGLARLVVAGEFGRHLDPDNLIDAGFLPGDAGADRGFAGNASLRGAAAYLLSRPFRERVAAFCSRVRTLDLASLADYQDLFMESLSFPERASG